MTGFGALRENLESQGKIGKFEKLGKTWKPQGNFWEDHSTQEKLRANV